jgi:transposase
MWDPYVNSILGHVADVGSKIVFDKFHIAKHPGDAVDRVRRRETKTLRASGDDRLAGTRTTDCDGVARTGANFHSEKQ